MTTMVIGFRFPFFRNRSVSDSSRKKLRRKKRKTIGRLFGWLGIRTHGTWSTAPSTRQTPETQQGVRYLRNKIAKVAKEQKFARVYVDLSNMSYSEELGKMLVSALSERGIDVPVIKSKSGNCLNDLKDKGRKGIHGLYKDGRYDIWFLPGADLAISENESIADNKAKAFLDKKNTMLRLIATDTNADIKVSEEMLPAVAVKEIFDALEKNPTDGTVTLPCRKDHPPKGDLNA